MTLIFANEILFQHATNVLWNGSASSLHNDMKRALCIPGLSEDSSYVGQGLLGTSLFAEAEGLMWSDT